MDHFNNQIRLIVAGAVIGLIVLAVATSRSSGGAEGGGTGTGRTPVSAKDLPPKSELVQMSPEERKEVIDSYFSTPLTVAIPDTVDLSLFDAPAEIGARAIKIPLDAKEMSISAQLTSARRCAHGDFDIIRTEMRYSPPGTKLLISIEPLGRNSTYKAVSETITPEEIESGKTVTFNVPTTQEAEHLGLYICKDSHGGSRCSSKQVIDLGPLMSTYTKLKDGESPPTPSDKVYFFQYLLLEKNAVTWFKNEVPRKNYTALGEYLGSRGSNMAVALDIAERVEHLNNTVRSATAEVRNGQLLINLPQNDFGLCRRQGVGLPPEVLNQLRAEAAKKRKKLKRSR